MTLTGALLPFQSELAESIERFRELRPAAQSELVRKRLDARSDAIPAFAGPLCLAVAQALGLSKEARRDAGITAGLVEAAAMATASLTSDPDQDLVTRAAGLPLALNSADAIYSLSHLAALDFALSLEGYGAVTMARFDDLAGQVWSAIAGSEPGAPHQAATRRCLGRLAGELAAFAAGRHGAAVTALGAYGEIAADGLQGVTSNGDHRTKALLSATQLSPDEQARLLMLLQ